MPALCKKCSIALFSLSFLAQFATLTIFLQANSFLETAGFCFPGYAIGVATYYVAMHLDKNEPATERLLVAAAFVLLANWAQFVIELSLILNVATAMTIAQGCLTILTTFFMCFHIVSASSPRSTTTPVLRISIPPEPVTQIKVEGEEEVSQISSAQESSVTIV